MIDLPSLSGIPRFLESFMNKVRSVGQPRDELLAPIPQEDVLGTPEYLRSMLTPTPTPTPLPSPTPTPMPGQIPSGTNLALDYYRDKTPNGQTLEQAFPILGDVAFMQQVSEADQLRSGLANLLLLQAFFESTGGRNTSNLFGVKPGGEAGQAFPDYASALEYQLGPNVYGGGANPNMNILSSQMPLTVNDVTNLYSSYDPEGAYLDTLISILEGSR